MRISTIEKDEHFRDFYRTSKKPLGIAVMTQGHARMWREVQAVAAFFFVPFFGLQYRARYPFKIPIMEAAVTIPDAFINNGDTIVYFNAIIIAPVFSRFQIDYGLLTAFDFIPGPTHHDLAFCGQSSYYMPED